MPACKKTEPFSGVGDAGRRHIPSQRNNMAALEALDSMSLPSPFSSTDDLDTSSFCTYGDIPIFLDPGIVLHMPEVTRPEDPANFLCVTAGSAHTNAIMYHGRSSADRLLGAHPEEPTLVPLHYDSRNTVPSSGYGDSITQTATGEPYSSISPYIFSVSVHDSPATDTWSVFPASPTGSSVTSFIGSGVSPVPSPSLLSFSLSPSCSMASHHSAIEDMHGSSSPVGRPYSNVPRSRSVTSTGTVGSSRVVSPSSSGIFSTTLSAYAVNTKNSLQIRRLQKSRSCYPLTIDDVNCGPRHVWDSQAPSSEPTTPFFPPSDLLSTLRQHRRTESNSTSASNRSMRSVRSSHISSPLASPVPKRRLTRNLPSVLDWLEDTRIELWMDQEGSHAVRQTFKLVGFTTGRPEDHDTALVNALTYGLAEFMPMMRRSFVFDSGKSDLPPTLRRVTIVDDEARDYVSYQATLATSSDGAYSVNGTEYFDFQRNQAPLVLRWRFEYFVQGGPRESEKTLTPLRFSCSPGLLHPSHGRKQPRVPQMFRRCPSARLLAEKIEVHSQRQPCFGPGSQAQGRWDLNDTDDGSEKENCSHGLASTAISLGEDRGHPEAAPEWHGSLRRQPSAKLRRSPRLTAAMLKPTTPTEVMGLYAEFLRTWGNGGCSDAPVI